MMPGAGSDPVAVTDVWTGVKELWTLVDDAVVRKLPGIPNIHSNLQFYFHHGLARSTCGF